MNKKAERELVVDSCRVYSLDRCFKCLNVLNLGRKTQCTVILKRPEPTGSAGETGMKSS